MHGEAVNALLKILEEPPEGVVFLLTTQSPALLLPTLVSRTRTVRFSGVPAEELRPLLEGLASDDAQFLLRFAQGAPGIIRRLRDDPELLTLERSIFAKATSFWQARSLSERLALLAPLHERSEEADQLLLHLSLSLREQLRSVLPAAETSLRRLIVGLQTTNVSRQLLVQQFAMGVGA
jgi:DNA polymerase III delta prime subunit